MKINFHWNNEKAIDEVDLISHPHNKEQLLKLKASLEQEKTLLVTHPSNNRKQLIPISQIEAITSLGHLTKVLTIENEFFFLNNRLKELNYLEDNGLYQINQSTLINLKEIKLFQKERLLCTNN
ncbi:LytTR family transcriptional regulator DNA-binding domain-containing protein [Vagococcus fluvialis]|uniref:LytTR family transcriptional regulator DNA-binding domain-containing protein n=1 Tax=Vagococcus fluvialis TaxID=2738 RepID=UPI0037D066C1